MAVTPALRGYAEKRLKKIGRYASRGIEAVVTLWVEGCRQVVDISLRGKGIALQAEGRTPEMYTSINEAVERVREQLKKHKEKVTRWRKEGTR